MIICLKDISEWFSFNVNINASLKPSLKILPAFRGIPEGTQAVGHLEGTWALEHSEDTRRALEMHSGTQVLRALRPLGALTLRALRQLGTWALRLLGYLGTRTLKAFGHSGT